MFICLWCLTWKQNHDTLHDTCILSAGVRVLMWRCCSTHLHFVCFALSVQLPSAAVIFCCPGTWHWFYLEGGEEDHALSPRAPLLPLSPCLFCCRDVIGLDGWKQYSREKPEDTDTLCHVRCVHRSDGDVRHLWFCIRFQRSLAQTLSVRVRWPRLIKTFIIGIC